MWTQDLEQITQNNRERAQQQPLQFNYRTRVYLSIFFIWFTAILVAPVCYVAYFLMFAPFYFVAEFRYGCIFGCIFGILFGWLAGILLLPVALLTYACYIAGSILTMIVIVL